MSFINWVKIVENFELSFETTFVNSDKKAHFDNLPEQYKVVDGAKLLWCHLLIFDAMISILLNESVSTSCRRSFHQHKLLVECIEKAVEHSTPEIFASITSEKNTENLKVASDILFQRLTQKFGPVIQHESLSSPWCSTDDMRLSFANGPTSKAKNKYFAITDMLLKHVVFSQFQNMDAIIRQVIHRTLFKYKSSIPPANLVPVVSFNGDASKKLKRVHAIPDENMFKKAKSFQWPRCAYPLQIDSGNNSVTSVMHLATCVPVFKSNRIVSVYDNEFGAPSTDLRMAGSMEEVHIVSKKTVPVAEKMARKVVEKLPIRGKEQQVLGKRKSRSVTCDSEDMFVNGPVSPRRHVEGDQNSVSSLDTRSLTWFDSDEDFESYDDDMCTPSSLDEEHCMSSELFNIQGAYETSGCQPSPLLVDHALPGQFVPVSTPAVTVHNMIPQFMSSNSPDLVVTINPNTTNYILRDNVLCAIVPVYDPRLCQGEMFGAKERASDVMNMSSMSPIVGKSETAKSQKMSPKQTVQSPTSVAFTTAAELDEGLEWLDDCFDTDNIVW